MPLHDLSSDVLLALLQLDPVVLQNGDTLRITVPFITQEHANEILEPKMVSAIFIGPTHAWCQARARELKYPPHEIRTITLSKHLDDQLRGMYPNDEGEPIIYLTGHKRYFRGDVDTPTRREFRWMLDRLKHEQFEIIDLDEVGMQG